VLLVLSVGSIREVLQLLLLLQTVVVRMLEISAPVLLLMMRKPVVAVIALPQILWLQVLQCSMVQTAAAMKQRRRMEVGVRRSALLLLFAVSPSSPLLLHPYSVMVHQMVVLMRSVPAAALAVVVRHGLDEL